MIFGKHINRYYLKYFPFIFIGLVTLLTVDYIQLIIPNLYQMVINGMNTGKVVADGVTYTFDAEFLFHRIFIPLSVIIIVIVLGRFVWRMMFIGSGIRMIHDLRCRMFDNAKDLSHEYYEVNKVGGMMSLFTNDLETIQDCFAWGILMFFDAVVLGGISIYKMSRMNPFLTILTMIPTALLLASSTLLGRYMMKKWDARQEAYSSLSDFSQESFSGIAIVKAFVKEAKELMAFKKLNRDSEKANVVFTRASVLLRILVTMFVESVICIILGYGGYLVYTGYFNAGQLMEFIGYFTAIVWPIMAVAELVDMTSRGRASLKRVGGLLDEKPVVKSKEDAVDLEKIEGKIEFKNLTFSHPGSDHDNLHNVSFVINAGEKIGIVGKTGAGKTTIVDLILRMYNVPDGTVFIDDKDINDITIRSLRNACAYVPQDNFLFSDTIEHNIAFGLRDYDTEDVVNAARSADVDSNITEFTEGYETVLGERGVTVSGGQKQRISIARALMKDAPILILDDSVSAVDTDTEKNIIANLLKSRVGKTTILIAHRISTIENMDRILFIERGHVLAFGTHDELINTCPEYRRMVELQKLDGEEADHE